VCYHVRDGKIKFILISVVHRTAHLHYTLTHVVCQQTEDDRFPSASVCARYCSCRAAYVQTHCKIRKLRYKSLKNSLSDVIARLQGLFGAPAVLYRFKATFIYSSLFTTKVVYYLRQLQFNVNIIPLIYWPLSAGHENVKTLREKRKFVHVMKCVKIRVFLSEAYYALRTRRLCCNTDSAITLGV